MAEHISPRVNSALLSKYVGRTVRLTCKVIRFTSDDTAVVQASDGGEVSVKCPKDCPMNTAYVEIIGSVTEPGVIRGMACVNLGDELDMGLVNFVVEKWHDPKFASAFATS